MTDYKAQFQLIQNLITQYEKLERKITGAHEAYFKHTGVSYGEKTWRDVKCPVRPFAFENAEQYASYYESVDQYHRIKNAIVDNIKGFTVEQKAIVTQMWGIEQNWVVSGGMMYLFNFDVVHRLPIEFMEAVKNGESVEKLTQRFKTEYAA